LNDRRAVDPWLNNIMEELNKYREAERRLKGMGTESVAQTEMCCKQKVPDNIQNDHYTNGFLGTAVTHYEKIERKKNEENPLRVQTLSKGARKRARGEEVRNRPEIIP